MSNSRVPDAFAFHARSLVLDTHADTPQRLLDEGWDFTSDAGDGMLSLATARTGGLNASFFALWVDPGEYAPDACLQRALALADAVFEQVRRHPQHLRLCLTPRDILAARAAGQFGILLSIEGGYPIQNSLANLRVLYRLGIRAMTLTWSRNTDWADSSGDSPVHGGLSLFGRQVVQEMNRLGMLVDVSHASDATFDQVLELSASPVIASHSSARAITPSPRNLTDAQLRSLRDTGGLAMVNFFPAFIDERWRQAWEATRAERTARQLACARPFRDSGRPVPFHVSNAIDREFAQRIGPPRLDSLIDHFEHMLHIAGPDHVGIGSDFDGIPAAPQGLATAAGLPLITDALARRGHPPSTLKKVLGANLLDLLCRVQSCARREEDGPHER